MDELLAHTGIMQNDVKLNAFDWWGSLNASPHHWLVVTQAVVFLRCERCNQQCRRLFDTPEEDELQVSAAVSPCVDGPLLAVGFIEPEVKIHVVKKRIVFVK